MPETLVLCSGQVGDKSLSSKLENPGIACHVISGANVVSELDAEMAIDHARLLATLEIRNTTLPHVNFMRLTAGNTYQPRAFYVIAPNHPHESALDVFSPRYGRF